jgi:tetratricopeptide (TPR) repeat protein
LRDAVKARKRRLLALSALGVLIVTLATAGGAWWAARRGTPTPATAHEPISVLIADFENRTGDSVFEGSLEQSLALGIEGASFVTSYRRETARRVATEIRQGADRLDQTTARLVAVREGVKLLLAGSIGARSSGYEITIRGVKPADGDVLFTSNESARDKADVLKAMSTLAGRVRTELGDATPETSAVSQETFTASSLEALRAYSEAQALSRGHDAEAIERYRTATRFDPNFGRAYAGWAISASRLGRKDEAAAQWKKALALLGRMTPRERYRTLGGYYLDFTRDYDQAIENYTTLVRMFPADEAGHSNLALASFYKRDFKSAFEEGRRALEMYPADLRFRNNLALYAMYAGDFTTATAEARRVLARDSAFHTAYLPLAIGSLEKGDLNGAIGAYESMARTGPSGASLSALGRADVALYRGSLDEAEKLLTEGITEDERAGNRPALARKYTALTEAYVAAGRKGEAARAATRALEFNDSDAVLVPAALALLDTGAESAAVDIARQLSGRIPPSSRAYAHLVSGRIVLSHGQPAAAIAEYRTGLSIADVWLLRRELGIAYVLTGQEQSPAALAELEACLKRRGEAMAAFLDDVPTARYLPPVHYWLGRAQEGVGLKPAALESYKGFLNLRPGSAHDPITDDARRRVAR